MKHTFCFITILLGSLLNLYANNENDSLLKVLDKVISERLVYTEKKEATIKELKAKKKEQKTLDDMYRLNSEILHQYETFVCDSAEQYINENIEIAKKLDNKTYLLEGRLQLAFVYSLSGGRQLVSHWEALMKAKGYPLVMTSTQSDETAQHFYRKLGYVDAGALLLQDEPLEIILTKALR